MRTNVRKHSESTHWSIYEDIPQNVSWAGYQIIASQPQSHPFWLFGENASGSFKHFFLCQLYQWAGLQRRGRRMVFCFWAGRRPAVPRGQQLLPTRQPPSLGRVVTEYLQLHTSQTMGFPGAPEGRFPESPKLSTTAIPASQSWEYGVLPRVLDFSPRVSDCTLYLLFLSPYFLLANPSILYSPAMVNKNITFSLFKSLFPNWTPDCYVHSSEKLETI